ncbi:MAG: phosphatidate cytidylyltransferase [Desulfobacteraceae bacterium]|jgi:phosphatidate cytidylyltransferase
MYLKRWLTALVLIPPFILVILKGSQLLFTFVLVVVATVCLWEYLRVTYSAHEPAVPKIYHGWGYLLGALVLYCAYQQSYIGVMVVLAMNLIGAAFMSIFRFKDNQDAPTVAIKQIFGILYIPFSISFIIMLRATPDGPYWVLFLFWVVAWGDTGALYVGSLFGRHKLCAAVSPKKTIEGAFGGLAANLIFAWLYKLLFFNAMNSITCTVFALMVGAAGQIGDLFESEFKRAAGVKDSSALLPGHGGLLDRLDAMLLAAPVAFLLKEYLLP